MTPEDKAFAREALQRGWMTVEQIERCRVVAEENSKALREIAGTYGYLPRPPARSSSGVFAAALIGALVIFVAGSAAVLIHARRESRRQELVAARLHSELMAQPLPAPTPDGTREAIEAEQRLRSGRAALRFVAENSKTLSDIDRLNRLEEAVGDFTAYLEYRPTYAPVLYDRARAFDMLGRLREALADYEAAAAADARHADMLRPRIAELRQVLRR
ncbi:MAG: hypothetical protein HY716_15680 [Planctomycetes bacterium]|nr:hypothetical protein [Planctomycetota bacterium]